MKRTCICELALALLIAASNCVGQTASGSSGQSIAVDEREAQNNPANGNGWEKLGLDYLQAGQYQRAVGSLLKAVENGYPAQTGKYNLACAYARLGEKQKALELLESLAASGQFPGSIINDPDLASLAGEPRFQELAKAAQRMVEPCKDAQANPQYRQLDFWVGEWDVFSGTQKVGESSVQLILKDCVVFENWSNLNGGAGKSLNKYNPVTRQWEQFWVEDDGTTNYFKGSLVNGEMRYVFETPSKSGGTLVRHLTFSKLPDGRVRQLSVSSTDAGKTWVTEYDFVYAKRQ
jgi:tetratricopeptide (TPR) repeat protein